MKENVGYSYSLPPLYLFTEKINPGEEREHEQYHNLSIISSETMEFLLSNKTHWMAERNFEEDEIYHLNNKDSVDIEEIIFNPLRTIVLGEIGVGKTCFLYHLYNYYSNQQSEKLFPIYLTAQQFFRNTVNSSSQSKGSRDTPSLLALSAIQCLHFNFDLEIKDEKEKEAKKSELLEIFRVKIQEGKALLLIDDVDLIPTQIYEKFFQLFQIKQTIDKSNDYQRDKNDNNNIKEKEKENENEEWKKCKIILSVPPHCLQQLSSSTRKSLFATGYQIVHLTPGLTFDILVTNRIHRLIHRWPMVEKSDFEFSGTQMNAFETALREHRQKLYADHILSPMLLFMLARRLAKGTSQDGGEGTDKEFSFSNVLEHLYDDCLLYYFQINFHSAFEFGDSNGEFSVTNDLFSKTNKFLIEMNVNFASIKRLCSFVGFLCHFYHPLSIASKFKGKEKKIRNMKFNDMNNQIFDEEDDENRLKEFIPYISHQQLIEIQFKHLFLQPNTLSHFGIKRNYPNSKIPHNSLLSKDDIRRMINELFELLSPFYKVTEEGNAVALHPCISEYLASSFLSDPSAPLILNDMLHTIEIPTAYNGFYYTLFFKPFDLSSSDIVTSWRWEGVLQLIGVQKGVIWLADQMLQSQSQSLAKSPNNKLSNSANVTNQLMRSQSTANPSKNNNKNLLARSNSAITNIKNGFENSVFEAWLKGLRIGYDGDDLGQIRIQIFLRIYSTICNHRPTYQNYADPLTEAISSLFLRLMEQTPTVLIHLETFPNYFLSCFNPSVAHLIIKKCLTIFTARSTSYGGNLISKFRCSPYLHTHLSDLINSSLLNNSQSQPNNNLNNIKLAIFNIINKVDDKNLEKHYISHMAQSLIDDSNQSLQREISNFLVNLGIRSAFQVPASLFGHLIDDNFNDINFQDPSLNTKTYIQQLTLPIITNAIKFMTHILRTEGEYRASLNIDSKNKKKDKRQKEQKRVFTSIEEKIMHYYYESLSTITALLEQPDPGARLLAYIALGCADFNMKDDDYLNGKLARKASLYLSSKLSRLLSAAPIFSKSVNQLNGSNSNNDNNISFDYHQHFIDYKNKKGIYAFTVSLNTLIFHVFGETASCWVSSIIPILKYKSTLFKRVITRGFLLLPHQLKMDVLNDILLHEKPQKNPNINNVNSPTQANYYSLYSLVEYQLIQSLLLLRSDELQEYSHVLHTYVEQLFLSRQIIPNTNNLSNSNNSDTSYNSDFYSLPPYQSFIIALKQLTLKLYEKIIHFTISYSPFTIFQQIFQKVVDESPDLIPSLLSVFHTLILYLQIHNTIQSPQVENNNIDITDDINNIMNSITKPDILAIFQMIETYSNSQYYGIATTLISLLPFIPQSKLEKNLLENEHHVKALMQLANNSNSSIRQPIIQAIGLCWETFFQIDQKIPIFNNLESNFHSNDQVVRTSSVELVLSLAHYSNANLKEKLNFILSRAFQRYANIISPPPPPPPSQNKPEKVQGNTSSSDQGMMSSVFSMKSIKSIFGKTPAKTAPIVEEIDELPIEALPFDLLAIPPTEELPIAFVDDKITINIDNHPINQNDPKIEENAAQQVKEVIELSKKECTFGIVCIFEAYSQLMKNIEFLNSFFNLRASFLPYLQSPIKPIQIAAIDCFSQFFYHSADSPLIAKSHIWNTQIKKEIFMVIVSLNCSEDLDIRSSASSSFVNLKVFLNASNPRNQHLNLSTYQLMSNTSSKLIIEDEEISQYPQQIFAFLTNCIDSKKYYERVFAISIFQFFGIQLLKAKSNQYLQLLNDQMDTVKIQSLRTLSTLLLKSSSQSLLSSSSPPPLSPSSSSAPLLPSPNSSFTSSFTSSMISSSLSYLTPSGLLSPSLYGLKSAAPAAQSDDSPTLPPTSFSLSFGGLHKLFSKNSEKFFEVFVPSAVKSLSWNSERVKREALNFLRLFKPIPNDAIKGAIELLNNSKEPIKVRIYSFLFLAEANQLSDQLCPAIWELIDDSNSEEVSLDITPYFTESGYPFARIIPKLIVYIESNHPDESSVKRLLLRFLQPHEDRLHEDYTSIHKALISMANDKDVYVRRKAAEIFGKMVRQLKVTMNHDSLLFILKELTKVLISMVADGNTIVRKEVANSLGNFGIYFPQLREEILDLMFSVDGDPTQSILVWKSLSIRWGIFVKKTRKKSQK